MFAPSHRHSTKSHCSWLTYCLLFCVPVCAFGQRDGSERLVDQLATTNPPATIKGRPGQEKATWKRFASKEGKRVDAVLKQVIEQSEKLWPELVAHLDDDRHCKTVGIDAGYPHNHTVGDICQSIIGETLSEAYYRLLGPASKATYHQFRIPAFAKDKTKLREWCLARKDRELYELQVEACEWAIAEIKGSDSDAKEEKSVVIAIKEEIEELKKTKKAVPCPCRF